VVGAGELGAGAGVGVGSGGSAVQAASATSEIETISPAADAARAT
jgi:hypothetical protein